MSSADKSVESAFIKRLVFGESPSSKCQIRMVSERYLREDSFVRFWHAIDVGDFSTLKTFVIPYPSSIRSVYEVDFLSRHELIPPMSEDKLPSDWQMWGEIRKNQIFITDSLAFRSRMLTADAFVAIPTYRFETLADDIDAAYSFGNIDLDEAVRKVLSSDIIGYSFKQHQLDV